MKKRKRNAADGAHNDLDTSKPTAVFKPTAGRAHTLSVALAGSIIANAQSHELKTAMAGQIARALAVFCVDEVVVFDDGAGHRPNGRWEQRRPDDEAYTGHSDPAGFLIHLLSYLETPPHLRKHLFAIHPNLRSAGTLPSLDMPHHLRAEEWCRYREGVAVESQRDADHLKKGTQQKRQQTQQGTYIEAGLRKPVFVDAAIPPHARVTLKFSSDSLPPELASEEASVPAQAVDPSLPRTEAGYYWGYSVRRAPSLSAVFTETPFAADGGYDVSVGTSERGAPLSALAAPAPTSRHALLVFGGVAGLESAVAADSELVRLGVAGAAALFDHWVDLVPGQGSRTIRTEEAVWLGLMGLRGFLRGQQ
ncbi:MAG: hypothetical protein M1832_004580 [Thelocarpon impressellum]|nr:MAG: hypothetical protein M1832_004580 [Thelocarpon impressellum]